MRTATFLTWIFCLITAAASSAETTTNIKLAYIGPGGNSTFQGISQGISEANLQGRFLGQAYQLDTLTIDQVGDTDLSPYIALLVEADSDTLLALSRKAPSHPVFNLNNGSNALREACVENLLHIVPSEKMKNDAVQQWRKLHPDAAVKAQAWHPDFVKFAARDLNKRYYKVFAEGMDDLAWAGWAAVKMTSDTVAREGITDPAKMLDYLKTKLSFDGQKGLDMNFRVTGQLRQPLLIVGDGKLLGEAPVRGVAKPGDVDSLGINSCPK